MKRRKLLSLLGLSTILPTLTSAKTQNPTSEYPNYLGIWKTLTRFPLTESNQPHIQNLILASHKDTPIPFYYHGGSTPSQLRLASIECVFRTKHTTRTYVSAYCHLRRTHRVFRADKISLA